MSKLIVNEGACGEEVLLRAGICTGAGVQGVR